MLRRRGGQMWLEEKLGERINQLGYAQLKASVTTEVAVACPYCRAMLSDAQREVGDENARTSDVIGLVVMAMKG